MHEYMPSENDSELLKVKLEFFMYHLRHETRFSRRATTISLGGPGTVPSADRRLPLHP